MPRTGRIRTRLALAIVLTALIPVLAAVVLSLSMTRFTVARLFYPEVGPSLDRSLGLYQELARTVKQSMRFEATAIALAPGLRKAAASRDRAALQRELAQAFAANPGLVSLVVREKGQPLASADRGRPLDESRELELCIVRALGEGRPAADDAPEQVEGDSDDCEPDPSGVTGTPELVVRLAIDGTRFKELSQLSEVVRRYSAIEHLRPELQKRELWLFSGLLGMTMIGAIAVAILLARGVVSRILELVRAMQGAGAGDLDVRVDARGSDEITDLTVGFNRMLGEIETSRARIEYLQRIEAWQEMARRLAHEIKNPLTPIQLAVQDIHRRYAGQDAEYSKLLDTALEIVEDEVGTLRRLVTEFSNFARLPQVELADADLCEFLEEQRDHLALGEEERLEGVERESALAGTDVRIDFQLAIEARPAPVQMDRHMFRRALINLVRNAVQAIGGAGRTAGTVRIALRREGDYWVVDVDDDGPGIPDQMRLSAFDPYVTTKLDGAGLGLAITKKIIVEHGGSVTADKSDLGGARVRIRVPAPGTAASRAALAARTGEPPSVRRDALSRPGGVG